MVRLLLILMLVTAFCAAAVELFYFFAGTGRLQNAIPPVGSSAGQGTDRLQTPASVGVELSDTEIIIERNLFAPGSGTRTVAGDSLAGGGDFSLGVILVGTITGADEEQRAVIYDSEEKKQRVYRRGDFVHQAVIKRILRGQVILSRNGREEVLDIAEARTLADRNSPVDTTSSNQNGVTEPLARPATIELELPAEAGNAAPATVRIRR